MATLTLELPSHLARQLANADPQTIVKVLEEGLRLHSAEGEATEHPHITRVPGILGGRPVIRGSRIPVWQVAQAILLLGDTVEDYLASHPHLTLAQVYDALSYYFDHREAIEKEVEENKTENVIKEFGLAVNKRGFAHFPRDEQPARE